MKNRMLSSPMMVDPLKGSGHTLSEVEGGCTRSQCNKIMRALTTTQRSYNMSRIRGKDTKPERTLRTVLFAKGFRYRLHVKNLPGSPDLVFPRYNAVVFVHGCFWHRHEGCRYTTVPARNAEFWRVKFQGNVDRDQRDVERLRSIGWRVAIVWECALRSTPENVGQVIEEWLHGNDQIMSVGEPAMKRNGD